MPPKKIFGRGSKARCARRISYGESSASARPEPGPSSPEPGPSNQEPGPSSSAPSTLRAETLADQLKLVRVAKATSKKHLGILNAEQKRQLASLRDYKQVGNFRLPDAPECKKGKGKGKGKGRGKEDTRRWVPCPLLPEVPIIPPPKVPQPWEIESHLSHETEAVAGMGTQTAGTPSKSLEPLMEMADYDEGDDAGVDIIEGSPRPTISLPDKLLGKGPITEIIIASNIEDPSTSSIGGPPQAKKQKMMFSPSTGIIRSQMSPINPVMVDIEFQGFTPTSTTSKLPGSGRSATSYEVGATDDQDLGDPGLNDGSDIDADNDTEEFALRQRSVFEYPVEVDESEDPRLANAIKDLDKQADVAVRALAEHDDYLHFDWQGTLDNFKGVREEFIGPSGPTFDVSGLSPLDIFKKIWDADIIAHIVRETNRYARQLQDKISQPSSRLRRWKDTTDDEIWRFLGILMLQSFVVNNVEREYWYPKLEKLRIGNFGEIMTYNRFVILKRCLHFVDNTLPGYTSKLHKVMPIIQHLNKKFSSLYLPEQNIAIDESLLLWKGRLSFAQLIATKRARVGIKSYELCESRTGYLWRMEVYTGKGHVHVPQETSQEVDEGREDENEPGSATSQIVFSLMRPLFNRGHTLVMDNFYNAPLLSRLLKAKYKTDTMGTLRLNREFVPESLKGKNKKVMRMGEVCFSTTKDLSVVVWLDKSVVAMISTYHDIKVGGKEKYGYYRYKPQVVLDYNLYGRHRS